MARIGFKRALIAGSLLSLVAAGAAFAFLATDFEGQVNGQPSSTFGFDVGRNAHGKRVATDFTIGSVAYTCDTAPDGSSGGYFSTRKLRIKHRKFSGEQNITEGGFDPVLTLTGKLDGPSAKGTLRLKGTLDTGQPDARCDTGTVQWKAERTAQPG
jgi:hypothetical protein